MEVDPKRMLPSNYSKVSVFILAHIFHGERGMAGCGAVQYRSNVIMVYDGLIEQWVPTE